MSDNTFKLQINFTKAYKGEDNVAYIEGIASGPEVDLTGERMSVDALKSMVESLKKRLVEFRDVHEDEWNSDLGEVVELSITPDNRLFYKAKLDLNLSGARDLWYRITEQGKKLGVSVGGSVVKAGYEYVAELGRSIYTYVDVDLSHIGITRQAAYQHSFANAVLKSLTKKENPMSKSQEVNKTDELEHQDAESQEDTNLTESGAAATADATEEAQDATQTETHGEEATQEESDQAAAEADAQADTSEDAKPAEGEVEKSTDADEQSEAATVDTTQEAVAKSAVFGDWAEISLVTSAIERLSWALQDHVWSALYDDEKSSQEKLASIADGLDDYKSLILKVATALVQDGNAEEVKRAAESFKATQPDAVAKSLTEKDAKVEELTKSLSATTEELETTKKSLAEKETELEKINARKGIVFDKFAKNQSEAEARPVHGNSLDTSIGDLYLQRIGAKP